LAKNNFERITIIKILNNILAMDLIDVEAKIMMALKNSKYC
jgi:hypothetical protein